MTTNKNSRQRQCTRGGQGGGGDPPQQTGSGASGYSHLWHSVTPYNLHVLNKYTADRLDNTPMFNPLKFNTKPNSAVDTVATET